MAGPLSSRDSYEWLDIQLAVNNKHCGSTLWPILFNILISIPDNDDAGKSLRNLQMTDVNMSQQCTLTVKERNPILGYIRKSVTIILKEAILSPLFKKGVE